MAAMLAGGFYANEPGRRALLWAAVGSIGLHLGLLFFLPLLQEAQRSSPVSPSLNARLAKVNLAKPAPPAPEPPPIAPPKIEPPARPVVQPRPEPVVKALLAQALANIPALPVQTPSVEARNPESGPPQSSPAPVARADPRPAPQSTGTSAPDPGAIARYRMELMEAARRFRKYPRIALDNDWQGRVAMHIAIGENGALTSLTVMKSAGRVELDEAAQAMLRDAKAQTPVPSALRGRVFDLNISVDFFLKDE